MIDIEFVLAIHAEQLARYGGGEGVREMNGLTSALARPFGSFGGVEYYPSVEEKAAAILQSIIINHPFVDGNKRTAYFFMQ